MGKKTNNPAANKPKRIILRDWSKGIFCYPLFLYSIIAMIIEYVENGWLAPTSNLNFNFPNRTLAVIWLFFFGNLFVMSFDFPTAKFLTFVLLFLVVVLIVWVFIATGVWNVKFATFNTPGNPWLDPGMTAQFYGVSAVITAVILIIAWIQSRSFYVRIEEGQVLIRHWFAADNEFSTSGLQVQIKVEDVFEWIALRARGLTLTSPNLKEPLHLETVPFLSKAEMDTLETMGSQTRVDVTDNQSPDSP